MAHGKRLIRVAALLLLIGGSSAAAKEPSVRGGRLVFELPGLDGDAVASSDSLFAGKVVLVTLWGTWCPPCRTEIPTLAELQKRYGDAGLVVVGIAFERDPDPSTRRQRLREFVEEHEVDYLVLDGGTTKEFSKALPMVVGAKGLPIEILVERTGDVAECRNGYGYSKKWAHRLERDVRRLLAENPREAP